MKKWVKRPKSQNVETNSEDETKTLFGLACPVCLDCPAPHTEANGAVLVNEWTGDGSWCSVAECVLNPAANTLHSERVGGFFNG